ncbi:TolC family outer membrane protein [Sulfurimonas sp.]|uniref:TolC family outer membrane protein n=1 Tax=Sulfurimonas sp. TaxID=2022749 RepID=UPI003D0ADE0B
MKKLIFLPLAISNLLYAQTLKESVGEILTTNPIIQERLKNYEANKEDVNIAQAGYYPTLNLKLGAGYEQTKQKNGAGATIIPTTGNDGKFSVYENSLTFTQNIFQGFNTINSVEEQKYKAISAAYSYIETANSISFEMTNAYIELIKNKELLVTAKKNVEIDQEILNKVKKLYDSGLTTLSEVHKIESSLALAKSNQVVQENTLLDATYNTQKVLGKELEIDSLEKPELMYLFPDTKEEAIEFALKNNPSILVGEFNVKQAKAAKHSSQSSYYPSVDIEVSQSMNKNLSAVEGTDDQFRAMAYLNYNIFNGFSDQASIAKAQKQVSQGLNTKEKLQREIIQNLNLAWTSKEKLEEQLKHLYDYKDFSEKTLKLYAKEYDLGRRSLLDLLSAQNDFIRSQSQIITTEYNILLAKYRILNAMGILVPVIIDEQNLIYTNVDLEAK